MQYFIIRLYWNLTFKEKPEHEANSLENPIVKIF